MTDTGRRELWNMIYRQAVVDMIKAGKIPMIGNLFVDAYNRSVLDVPPTITTRVNSSNNYFVTTWDL